MEIGAEALIKGRFRLKGDRIEVEARLFEVVRSTMVAGKRYQGKASDFRRIAHSFSNEVVRFFTGEPGIFDTRIAFVSSRRGSKEIFLMDYDGFSPRQITRNDGVLDVAGRVVLLPEARAARQVECGHDLAIAVPAVDEDPPAGNHR